MSVRVKTRQKGRAEQPPATTPTPKKGLRADAARNRRRILEEARIAFTEHGVQASLEEIAARAGVGSATLYRRFPTREDLIAASYEDKLGEHAREVEEALRDPDPWSGLCGYLTRICAMQAEDRGLRDVLRITFKRAQKVDEARSKSTAGFLELVRRAQAAGALRDDFVLQDLELLLIANAGVIDTTADNAPDVWKRFVGLMLDAFRADRATPLPAPPETRLLRRLDADPPGSSVDDESADRSRSTR